MLENKKVILVFQKSRFFVSLFKYILIRQTERVELPDDEMDEVEKWIVAVAEIIQLESYPPTLPISKCKSCSYFDFCWVGEE